MRPAIQNDIDNGCNENCLKTSSSQHATRRINWIDGLRGIGCVCIVLHHFTQKYFPASYFGPGSGYDNFLPFGLDEKFAQLPFFFLLNGNFWVCIYLMISGFVIANKSINSAKGHSLVFFIRYFIRRYLTLMLPILIAELALLVGTLVFPDAVFPDGEDPLTLVKCLKSSLFGVFFTMDMSVINPFWMMVHIFLGGLLVLFLRLLIRNLKILLPVYMILMALGLLNCYLGFFVPVLCGAFFCAVYPMFLKYSSPVLSYIALLFSLFLAAYPTGMAPTNIYRFLPYNNFSAYAYHTMGAVLFLYAFSTLDCLQNITSSKTGLWLGKISYPVYVFHIVVLKVLHVFHLHLMPIVHSYVISTMSMLLFSFVLIFVFASLYEQFVGKQWRLLLNKYLGSVRAV